MSYPIEQKLVVGVAATALFDLETEDELFKTEGLDAYRRYQTANKDVVLEKGLAFPFVRRFLDINRAFPDQRPVEVVLLSKNSPETGLRIFRSIERYGLDISRAAFTSGRNPCPYMPAYNVSLFLTTNRGDVDQAMRDGYPAGVLLKSVVHDDEHDRELRIAFDFDGVLADDSAERVYQEAKRVEPFLDHEVRHKDEPMQPGLLKDFFSRLSYLQRLESERSAGEPGYEKIVRTAIVTARNAPAHERAVNTLRSWNVEVDEMFFLGGIDKRRVLSRLKPHLYFDDQIGHLDQSLEDVTLVHIPFGVINQGVVEPGNPPEA